jgi:hypothetical protein
MPSAGVGRFVLSDVVQLEHLGAFAVGCEDRVTFVSCGAARRGASSEEAMTVARLPVACAVLR